MSLSRIELIVEANDEWQSKIWKFRSKFGKGKNGCVFIFKIEARYSPVYRPVQQDWVHQWTVGHSIGTGGADISCLQVLEVLKQWQQKGLIKNLVLQPKFLIAESVHLDDRKQRARY